MARPIVRGRATGIQAICSLDACAGGADSVLVGADAEAVVAAQTAASAGTGSGAGIWSRHRRLGDIKDVEFLVPSESVGAGAAGEGVNMTESQQAAVFFNNMADPVGRRTRNRVAAACSVLVSRADAGGLVGAGLGQRSCCCCR